MKKHIFVILAGVFCLSMSGCLSLSEKEIPEKEQADTADIPQLLLGTWEMNSYDFRFIFDKNGIYVFGSTTVGQRIGNTSIVGFQVAEYSLLGNILSLNDTTDEVFYPINLLTDDPIIQIHKNGKEMIMMRSDGQVSTIRKFRKINDNHDLNIYADQIKQRQELLAEARVKAREDAEKAEATALERKVAAGYTDAGIIRIRIATPPGFYRYASASGKHRYYRSGEITGDTMLIGFSITKINGKDPVMQLGDNYWIPAGPCKITCSLSFQGGNDLDVVISGNSGWIETTSPIERTVEGSIVDGKSYDLVFEMDERQVASLFSVGVGSTQQWNYDVRIVPR